MNGKVFAAIVGVITLGFGIFGLVYPAQLMPFANLAPLATSSPAAVYGEVRAVYGGMLVMLGILTLWSAMDPVRFRSRLQVIGLAWLGVFAGRMFGVFVDGSPGALGWVNAAMELAGGVLLLAAPYLHGARVDDVQPATTAASPEPL